MKPIQTSTKKSSSGPPKILTPEEKRSILADGYTSWPQAAIDLLDRCRVAIEKSDDVMAFFTTDECYSKYSLGMVNVVLSSKGWNLTRRGIWHQGHEGLPINYTLLPTEGSR